MKHHFRERDTYTQILEITPAIRHQIEATIENLIELLDVVDPHGDLEPDNDNEPSLGWSSSQGCGDSSDLEQDDVEVQPW